MKRWQAQQALRRVSTRSRESKPVFPQLWILNAARNASGGVAVRTGGGGVAGPRKCTARAYPARCDCQQARSISISYGPARKIMNHDSEPCSAAPNATPRPLRKDTPQSRGRNNTYLSNVVIPLDNRQAASSDKATQSHLTPSPSTRLADLPASSASPWHGTPRSCAPSPCVSSSEFPTLSVSEELHAERSCIAAEWQSRTQGFPQIRAPSSPSS